ncbi:hypothetical protein [Haloglomus salinum]|jgi:hypothetical protein|uniref:hypothetical protein n=1 Tax=Haloglomus salinum TaxID=2962673 RepID=UPI0020C9E6DA|nr:hypothetical protein [Haloglomus salinum]
MSAAREPCPNCQLPYYTDRNSDCPYCGALAGDDEPAADESAAMESTAGASASVETSPAGSVAGPTPPSRPRTVCSNCGLAHYADDDNGCPYCTMAGRAPDTAAEAETGGVAQADTNAVGEAATETGGSAAPTAEPAATTAAPEETDTVDDQSSGGFLSRLRNLFS